MSRVADCVVACRLKLGYAQCEELETLSDSEPARGSHAFAYLERLFLLGLTAHGGLVQGEEHDLLAGNRADIVVQGPHFDARRFFDHRIHQGPCCFDQMGPNLLEQISPLLGWQRSDEMLFRRGQNASQADDQQIVDQVRVNVLRASAHVILFEADHPAAHRSFDFSLCFHDDLDGYWHNCPAEAGMTATRKVSPLNHAPIIDNPGEFDYALVFPRPGRTMHAVAEER